MTRSRQPAETFADMKFPLAGIDLSRSFSQQTPRPLQNGDYGGTTPVGQNVRAYEPGTARSRGGQRPGLKKYISSLVGGAHLIQEVNVVVGVGYTPPGPGGGTITLPQPPTQSTTGTGTMVATFANPVTTGNAIVVCTTGYANFGSVSDAAGNSYTTAVSTSVDFTVACIKYCTNVVGGFSAVTVAFTNGTANAVFVYELGGVKIASPVDGTTTGFGIGSPSGTFGTVGGALTTTVAGDILIGVLGSSGGVATMTTAGFAPLYFPDTHFLTIYQPSVPVASYNPAFTFNHNAEWAACLAAFKKA